ncbi:MAG: class I SAM-dependent methyltransferase [Candidatus Zambryskibacteria bacterium]|nr:class I SAM-dependent methyltransferase [Candidatus Zambryskibacteria bacterium]
MTDWKTYYKEHLSRPPSPLLVKALKFCKNKDLALDLGAGTLIESKFLLDSGFKKVVAVDSSPEVETFAKEINDKRLEVSIIQYKDLILLPDSYDLIIAQFALPFYGPTDFELFIGKLISSLKPDGVFAGQFFGNRDDWKVKGKNLAFQTIDEAKRLLKDLKVEVFSEKEAEGTVASGEAKHWHVFHFIAIK